MGNSQREPDELGKPDPQVARTKDNPIGIDDIGLPSGISPDELPKLEEIRPDPAKLKDK
ncbi:hypothetical protein [Noviherbaspirillum sp.]|uniref:hypothetical protein n=1 Tax=Noviherbaspirillum sp. TaxID=1926288 RepID=UPI002B472EF3|nr:hypothetical protein [Noviherbaspirillum sp.]HJV79270.1 hypothetical protein [Noviherbaspirillum sp.]